MACMYFYLHLHFQKLFILISLSKCAKGQQQGAAPRQFLPSHILTCRIVEALCNKKKVIFWGRNFDLISFFMDFCLTCSNLVPKALEQRARSRCCLEKIPFAQKPVTLPLNHALHFGAILRLMSKTLETFDQR